MLNKKGGLAILSEILKWGVLNKKYFGEKNGKKIKLPPPIIRHGKVINSKQPKYVSVLIDLMIRLAFLSEKYAFSFEFQCCFYEF